MKNQSTSLSSGLFWGLTLGVALFAAVLSLSAQEARFFRVAGPVPVTITGFNVEGTITWTNAPTNATFTVQTATSLGAESNWVDYVQVPVTNGMTAHRLLDPNPPAGMALIPAGSFTMGNCMDPDDSGEGWIEELPLHTVYVSAFYMDRTEVTKALWDEVYGWAVTNGYSFDNAGWGKVVDHPVNSITWYDVVKWCNARSEKEGRVPAYCTSAGQTAVYRTGQVSVDNDSVKWNAGYRLATEAEWEKAARGGASGQRFPWGDTITHGQSNYYSSSSDAYDVSLTRGYHPTFDDGVSPYTSPAGSFGANGYGLYDMAGNVWEWCWDWYSSSYYSSSPSSDPRGPASGSNRVVRGGGYGNGAIDCRTAIRYYGDPGSGNRSIGFRSVLSPGQ